MRGRVHAAQRTHRQGQAMRHHTPAHDGPPTRRRCNNCGRLYWPKKEEQKFCSDNCRKQFHRAGGLSYAKLENLIENIVEKKLRKWKPELAEAWAEHGRKEHEKENAAYES